MAISLAVVTGATGHLGNTLVRHLLELGVKTRVLIRPDHEALGLEGLAVERVEGDITDGASLDRAFAGAEVVFHVAGLVSITTGKEAELDRVNVQGTREVVAACQRCKVRRLVYTSSVHALTEPTSGTLDEAAGFDPLLAHGAYGKSKAAASKLVQDAARAGQLDAVLVLPTGCLGPWDFRFSEVGNLVARVGRRRMPVIMAGGYEWVDVRDVAIGTVLAAEQGRSGEAYLLNGSRETIANLCGLVAKAAGVKPPAICLPLWVGHAVAIFGPPWERLTGRRALITPYSVHTVAAPFTVSSQKARAELGFTSRPLETSLAEAWDWLKTHPHSPLQRAGLRIGPGRTLSA